MLKKFIRPKLRRISRSLNEYYLTRPTFDTTTYGISDRKFLGYYTEYGLNYAFNKYGLSNELKKLGFEKLRLKLFPAEFNEGKVFIYSEKPKLESPIIECVLSKFHFTPQELKEANREDLSDKNFLKIEWLAMQNPLIPKNDLYPGQNFKGLGLGRFAYELFLIMKWRLKLDGLVNCPDHYHNAYIYSNEFQFLDKTASLHFNRIKREFTHLTLKQIAWRIEKKTLYFDDGSLVVWHPCYQIRH